MIKIAICDDEKTDCDGMDFLVKKYFKNENKPVWTATFKNGQDLIRSHVRFDIIFLDIEMPELNGIETAQYLRKWDVNSKIIYVTNHSTYKASAYKVHAFDYIEKPIKESVFFRSLKEAVFYLENACLKKRYSFKTKEGFVVLELDDIIYLEYLARQLIIHTSNGNYITSYSLKELFNKLQKYNFESPHKSFITNMLHIKYIKGFEICMENGDKIPLAQKRAVGFKSAFNDYLQSTFDQI